MMNASVLSKILGLESHSEGPRYRDAKISLRQINVLRQPRQTFETSDIQGLADSIDTEGLINPLLVIELDEEGCKRHLEAVNLLWDTEYGFDDLEPASDNSGKYFILIAGEQRYRASMLLPGAPDRDVRVTLGTGESPVNALFKQLAENIHKSVPTHEEADAYYRLFLLIRRAMPEYPMAKFARSVGRSPETIRRAVRFCELPESVRIQVESGAVTYGAAIQLARLREAGLDDEDLLHWMMTSMLVYDTVAAFKKAVDDFLEMRNSGQGELFELSAEDTRNARRKVVEAEMVRYLWHSIHYQQRVASLLESGLLGEQDVYSEGSPLRLATQMVRLQADMLPKLLKLATGPKRDRLGAEIIAIGEAVKESS